MGPRPVGRGRLLYNYHYNLGLDLQWSRGLSAAESDDKDDHAAGHYLASMEPRPPGRGGPAIAVVVVALPATALLAYLFAAGPGEFGPPPRALGLSGLGPAGRLGARAATGMFLSMRPPAPPLGATMIKTTTVAMLGAVVGISSGPLPN